MKTMWKTKKSRSHDQAKLKVVCDDLCDNIEVLLDHLDLEYKNSGKMITMRCPIHGGDNDAALNLYYVGDTYRGNWKCRTHHCENIFKGSILGFVRGVLSRSKYNWSKDGDKTCTFDDALNFCLSLINKDLKSIKISNIDRNKKSFLSVMNQISPSKQEAPTNYITRDIARKTLEIPSAYFIHRGFTANILDKYDVGLCDNPNKEMYKRAVAPIYDNDYKHIVGCTGRSIYSQCGLCKTYHSDKENCPSDETKWKFPKWKHNSDFRSQNYLYNFWFAKEYIKNNHTVVLVESPGNVWRLEEAGIHNSVAMFGSSLSDRQKICLDASGAMNLVILTDNDDAGRMAAEKIKQKCQNTYRIYTPTITKPDIAEMTVDEINETLKPMIENLYD